MGDIKTLKQKIFNHVDIPMTEVHVPQWDVTLQVRGLSGKQRAKLMQAAVSTDVKGESKVDLESLYPAILIATVYESGAELGAKPIFSEEDTVALMAKSGAAIELLAGTAMKLSGMGADDLSAAKKDSSSEGSAGSTSS